MSTIAGMYFMRSAGTPGQDIQPPGCSVVDSETNLNLSEDDNTSCSASEMGCDLTTSASHNNNNNSNSSSNSRKNKRKNFKPRNITEYAGSDEEEGGGGGDHGGGMKVRHNNHNHHPHQSHHHNRLTNNHHSSSPHLIKQRHNTRSQVVESKYSYEDEDEGDGDEDDEGEMLPSPEGDGDLEDNNNMSSSRNGDIDDMDCTDEEGDGEFNEHDDGDGPLDLSEVQNDSKRLWKKPNKESLMNPLQSLNNNNLHDPSTINNSHSVGNHGHHHINNNNIDHFPVSMAAMDLRLARNTEFFEGRSEDLMITSSTGSSSNSIHSLTTNNNSAVLNDFAETTMKELLGLYGIAENLRQAGKQPNTDIPGIPRQLENSGHPTKMVLPENMARLLAAMQESVTAANANVNANSPPGEVPSGVISHHLSHNQQHSGSANSSPSLNAHLNSHQQLNSLANSFANIHSLVQQPQISSGDSPGNSPSLQIGSNHNLHNHIGGSMSNDGHFGKHSSKNKPTGKSPSGRGLTSFPVIREGLLGKGTGPVDYTRYVRRFSNSAECGFQQCRELNYREHFHCLDCGDGGRVFVKKEEMIRHFKWHKKRDESLQHGFMRYSPMDDCSDRFRNCTHNRKQTHYHCLQDGCEKVYISTSDVQMHANYHRKDSAIIQEGFQRFRAAEDCGADHCGFRHQRTTHFHCRRTSCSYTFKNKADMEKHKSYHIKDEQLNRDGFKKFMKHEACHYANCRFSRVCNHIHCIREGCNYVLHSSGQLYSHKRKHERRDSELAYRKFKLAQSVMRGNFGSEMSNLGGMNESLLGKSEEENSRSSINDQTDLDSEDIVKKFIQQCKCDVSEDEHFHCKVESCVNALLGTTEVASEHSRNHELEDRISSLAFFTVDPANFDAQDSTIPCISAKCPYQTREKHFHCLWDGCTEVILGTDDPFKRLEHFKAHQYSQKLDISDKGAESLDGFFKRKRGRPPKNRMIEVSSGANEAIFTSFKLPKPIQSGSGGDGADNSDSDLKDPIGFLSYPEGTTCPDSSCSFNLSTPTCHYHCGHPRCHFSVADVHKLSLHLRDFHSNVDILDGYEYFERNSDCRNSNCEFNNSSDHFHCSRDGYKFVRYTSMMSHESECHETKSNASSDDDEGKQWSGQVVKASGTFFPVSSLNKNNKGNNNSGDAMDLSGSNGVPDHSESKPITDHSLSRILQLPVPETGETQFGPDAACGRPFCKLKRKHHFHCHLCNQAFSELEKLRPHVLKHNNFSPLKIADQSDQSTDEESSNKNDSDDQSTTDRESQLQKQFNLKKEEINAMKMDGGSMANSPFNTGTLQNFLAYPGSHSPYLFLQQNPLTSLYAGMMFGGSPGAFPPGNVLSPPPIPPTQLPPTVTSLSDNSSPSSVIVNNSLQINKQSKRSPSACSSSPSSPPDSKKARLQMRILKDEPVPDGYIRFRFNEDCAYVHCGYREHQTHFHCTREDCGYSFCDKTRFVQHTARHERLDTLMGGDFKQFRANIPCGRANCAYIPNTGSTQGQNKASHFHCSKCDFVCTDTNKVVAHRRQHQKLDSIMAAGFEKFTPSQHCHIEACIHAQKQTHYHCLKCSYAVLGLSQMSAHKYRHVD